jgi:guanylate kinase
MAAGTLILFVGPRGGGKTTAIEALQEKFININKCVTATTRDPRPGEKFGIHNFFVSRKIFEWMLENNQIVEYTEYLGELYGTPEFELDTKLETNHVAVAIDTVGADTYQSLGYKPFVFFISPPSEEVQFNRIKARDTLLSDKQVDDQMRDTEKEYEWFRKHPVAIGITNNTPEQMVEEIVRHLEDANIGLLPKKQ